MSREPYAIGRPAARLRPPGPPAARPARRAHPRARRRARRERAARGARPRVPRRRRPTPGDEPLTLNVSMPIAAVMLDLGFAPDAVKSRPDPRPHRRPARPPGRGAPRAARLPDGGGGRGRDRRTSPRRADARPEVETRPWAEQLADRRRRSTASSSRYLLERSAFYREKLGAAGIDSADERAVSPRSPALPLTEKPELRATARRREPDRGSPLRRARGDRADLLHQRHHRRRRATSR